MIETDLEEPPYTEHGEPSAFTVFMKAYPSNINRDGALKQWWRLRPDLKLEATIMRSIRCLKETDSWRNGYTPSPANFLRDRRWQDAEGLSDPAERKALKLARERRENSVDVKPKPSGDNIPFTGSDKSGDLFVSRGDQARASMRQGLIEGWKAQHPDKEPPQALLDDPVEYVLRSTHSL